MSFYATSSTQETERLFGRVKWFNNKAGYGFITVTDGPRSGSDVFVHHTAISVVNQQYRYLVQGEYVEFSLVSAPNHSNNRQLDNRIGKHEFIASNVSGIKGGKVMCDTRTELKNKVSERFGDVFGDLSNTKQTKRLPFFESITYKEKRPQSIIIERCENRQF
jgi:cold shock CspA family protein